MNWTNLDYILYVKSVGRTTEMQLQLQFQKSWDTFISIYLYLKNIYIYTECNDLIISKTHILFTLEDISNV